MVVHDLKTLPEYFDALLDGRKSFELRCDDRNYGVGDVLCLREYEPMLEDYTGRACRRVVIYALRNGPWLRPGYIALGLGPVE